MSLDLDSGLDAGAVAQGLPLSRHAAARFALAAVVLVDAVAFLLPQAALVAELRHEMSILEERQRAAQLEPEAPVEPTAPSIDRRDVQSRLNPRDLLPTVAALARQEGIQIVTVKQSAVDKQGASARRLHLQARGAFGRIVAFIDAVSAAIPLVQVEDLVLRHLASPSQQDAGIELEYVVSVPSLDSRTADSAETFPSRTR